MSSFSGKNFPALQLVSALDGLRIRNFRKRWNTIPVKDTRKLVQELAAQARKIKGLQIVPMTQSGIAIYFDPILKGATLRVVFSPRGGAKHQGRYDIWHPLLHKSFLAEMYQKRPDIKIVKCRGVVVTNSGLFQLDAMC